jgi:signal transduction histidine kinase/signal transduction protein with GAF and PtsI domain
MRTFYSRVPGIFSSVIILSFFVVHFSAAQSLGVVSGQLGNLKIDSLEKVLPATTDTNRIKVLDELARLILRLDPAKSMLLVKEEDSLSHFYNYQPGLINSMNRRAEYNSVTTANYGLANELAFKALKQSEKLGYKKGIIESYAVLSVTLRQQGETDKSIEFQNKAIELLLTHSDDFQLAKGYSNLGSLYVTKGQGKLALEYYDKALVIFVRLNEKGWESVIYNNIGDANMYMGKYEEALKSLRISVQKARAASNKRTLAYALSTIGEVYERQGDYKRSLNYMDSSLTYAEELNLNDMRNAVYEFKSRLYARLGQYEKAYDFLQRHILLKDSIFSAKSKNQVTEMENALALEKKQKEIDEANAEAEQQKTIRNIMVLGSLILVLVLMFAIRLFLRTKKANKILDIQKSEIQIQRDEIHRSQENLILLSEIGKQITSTFDIREVTRTVYSTINNLMDASGFGVGLVMKEKNTLEFQNFIEKGIAIPVVSIGLEDKKVGVICVRENREIIINNYAEEYSKYIEKINIQYGEMPLSLIYIPIKNDKEVIGALTVQSFKINAYKPYHIDLLRNIALYISIAIRNATVYNEVGKANVELEMHVAARTKELLQKNKEIESTNNNIRQLSEIGKKITSTFNIEEINSTIYENVNGIMDASVFAIGIINEEQGCIEFKGAIEKGEELPFHVEDLEDKNRYSVWCIDNMKEVFINDFPKEYKKYIDLQMAPVSGDNSESMIYYPLIVNGRAIGAMTVQSFVKNAYTFQHLEFIKNLAIYASIALQNANTYRHIERQKDEILKINKDVKLLGEIGQQITSTLNLDEILFTIYQRVNELMDATVFGIGLYNKTEQQIEYELAIEKGHKYNKYVRDMNNKNQLPVWCIENAKPIFINNMGEEYGNYVTRVDDVESKLEDGSYSKNDHVQSMIYVPVMNRNEVVGIITVQSFERDMYDESHLNMLKNLAVYTGIALENAKVYHRIEEQKDEIIKRNTDVQLLSEIGRKITSSLDVEEIIATAYKNVNLLMDASFFGIGIVDEAAGRVNFSGAIEKAAKMPDFGYDISDETRYSSWCVRNREEVIILDHRVEYVKYMPTKTPPLTGEDTMSFIYIPLIANDKVVGVFSVQSFEVNAYTPYHFDIVRTLGVYISSAIVNANIFKKIEEQNVEIEKQNQDLEVRVEQRTEQLQKKTEEIETAKKNIELLSEIGKKITSTLKVEEITHTIYESVNSLMDASGFGVCIVNKKENTLDYPNYIENGGVLPFAGLSLEDENRLGVLCVKRNVEVIINEFEKEYTQYLKKRTTATAGKEAVSLIYIPITSDNEVIGAITVQSFKKDAYNPYHIDLLRNIAIYAGIGIQNARLFTQINTAFLQLKEAQTQLVQSEKMASLGQLTAGVAHEINNPINYVSAGIDSLKLGYEELIELLSAYLTLDSRSPDEEQIGKIELLKKNLDIDDLLEEMETLFKSIKTGANRTKEIVKSLRTFSRLDENALKPTNLEEGLDSTLIILQNQLKGRVDIVRDYGRIPDINCFPGPINQVFLNILNNAGQAIEGEGKIWISTRIEGNWAVVSIKDSGMGMPEEVKKKIFDPFFTTKDVGTGTGLGLSITLGVIEKHNGKIEVNSEPGKGTEFIIKLPIII